MEELRRQVETLLKEVAELRAEGVVLREENAELKARVEELQSANAELQLELAQRKKGFRPKANAGWPRLSEWVAQVGSLGSLPVCAAQEALSRQVLPPHKPPVAQPPR